MILYCSFLILCCSFVQSWHIKSQRVVTSSEGHDQLRKDALPEDRVNSPETARVEKIIKSSVFPFPGENEDKFSPEFSHISPENVNTTIRLKFIKAKDLEGKPLDYDLKQDVSSNKHASHSHTQEMSSHKIILYNETKTQDEASKSSSQNMLKHLNTLKWPAQDESQIDLKDFIISKTARSNYKDATPDVTKKEVDGDEKIQKVNSGRLKQNLDNEQAILDMLKQYVETRESAATTETPTDKRYKISEPQMQLLSLLYKLVQSKEITYDFINRLVYLFHTHGYQNQLLQVLFDFIIQQLQLQGNSVDQQKTLNNLMEIWKVLSRLQGETQDHSIPNEKHKPDKPSSSDKLKVLKILRLLKQLKEDNKNGQNVLRSDNLDELRSLYDSVSNKNDILNLIKDHLQNFDENELVSIEKILSNVPGHGAKQVDISELIRSILKQKDLDYNKKDLLDHDQLKPSLHKIEVKKSEEKPRDDRWKTLFDNLAKNKDITPKKPNDLLVFHKIVEEFDEDDRVPIKSKTNTDNHFRIKKKKKPFASDDKESTERMYQVLLELLQSSEIRNKEELKVKIIEMLRKIKSKKANLGDDSGQDDQVDLDFIMNILNKQKKKPVDAKVCVIGTSWTVGCQSCICMVGGVPVCKRILECSTESEPEKPMQCKPHSKFRLDKCNTCQCNSAGVPICTLMECDERVATNPERNNFLPEQDAVRAILCPPEKKMPVCAPRTSWRGGCYDCICDEDGQRRCNIIKNCKIPSQVTPLGSEIPS